MDDGGDGVEGKIDEDERGNSKRQSSYSQQILTAGKSANTTDMSPRLVPPTTH